MTRSKLLIGEIIFLSLFTFTFFLEACNKDEIDLYAIGNPIINASFESPIDFNTLNSVWQKHTWQASGLSFKWEKGMGYNGSNCISLSCGDNLNDIALIQNIQLEGGKIYRLSAWIKTQNVVGGRGANICLFGTWQSSDPLVGTNEWKQVSMVFIAPETGEVSIACRLGFWGGTASGKAWFDNLEVKEVDMFRQQSQHIQLLLKNEDASAVTPATIDNWLSNLDKAYDKYYELIGQYPYDGKIITIFSTDTYPGGWAVAGNPILWHQPYVKSTLLNIENRGDWSFGILHEIGHDFAPNIGIEGNGNWDWDEEMFANLRMYYVVEMLNASVVLLDKVYTGDELKTYYKSDAEKSYESDIEHDGLMYTLIRIKDEIGWDPFKQTYRYLYQNETNLTGSWQKFNLFLDKLSEYSGMNVRETYPEGELDIIKEAMNNE